MRSALDAIGAAIRVCVGLAGIVALIATIPAASYGDYRSALVCAGLGFVLIGASAWDLW